MHWLMSDTKYWVGFTLIPGIGRAKFSMMEQHFGTMEKAWHASASELQSAGLDRRSVDAVVAGRASISLDTEMEKLERYRVTALTWKDAGYPAMLKEIYDLPAVLYVRGSLAPRDALSVAVVGTRRPTYYGRETAEQVSGDLARDGVTIISGLAKGIDAVAHRAALAAGGRTIAVFGCGLDIVYPSDHASLAREVIQRGALVSEFPLGTRPRADNFPRRNRIMSGLSLGVLVVEARESSGALITARWALEQNRDVFAVPGSILSPASRGTNHLIQEGAKLVTCSYDVLEELNLTAVAQQAPLPEPTPASDTEALIMTCLSPEPTHIDEVGRQCGLPIATVSSALTMMELKGLVRQVSGMNYTLAREARERYKVRVE